MIDSKKLEKEILFLIDNKDIKQIKKEDLYSSLKMSESSFYRLFKSKENVFEIGYYLKLNKLIKHNKLFTLDQKEKISSTESLIKEEADKSYFFKVNLINYSDLVEKITIFIFINDLEVDPSFFKEKDIISDLNNKKQIHNDKR